MKSYSNGRENMLEKRELIKIPSDEIIKSIKYWRLNTYELI